MFLAAAVSHKLGSCHILCKNMMPFVIILLSLKALIGRKAILFFSSTRLKDFDALFFLLPHKCHPMKLKSICNTDLQA